MEDKSEIRETLRELHEIMQILYLDFLTVADYLLKDPSNFWLRAYVRAFFAIVEGTTFGIKQVALAAHKRKPYFADAEISLLEEVAYELNDRGEAKIKVKILDTLANVRFAFQAVIKVFGLETEIKYDDSGWQSFQEALKIRHQITHPKIASLLKISDADDGQGKKVDVIAEASQWYANQINALYTDMRSAIESKHY